MKAIIAVNKLGYIGKDGGLPWLKCPEDLKHFKRLTHGGICVAGHNTLLNLPTLPGRLIFEDKAIHQERIVKEHKNIWCIGGKKTYEKYCHLFTELHISYIDDHSIGDTMFPDLRNLNPDCEFFHYNF